MGIIMKLSTSKRLNVALYEMGIYNYYDIIDHIPINYEDFHASTPHYLKDKEKVVFYAKIVTPFVRVSNSKGLVVTSAKVLSENDRTITVTAFNRPYLTKIFKSGDEVSIIASFDALRHSFNVINIIKGIPSEEEKIRPIYSLPNAIENHVFRRLVQKAFVNLEGKIISYVPYTYLSKYRLLDKEHSLRLVHFPTKISDIFAGYRYLKYEECLLFALRNKFIRQENESLIVQKSKINLEYLDIFINKLPYSLTNDQKLALDEIVKDMNDKRLMYRLLQGDVGSGKTLVAALAMYANFLRNEQSAFMAPTDTLARQHYETLSNLFSHEDVKVALLVGKTSKEERENIKSGLLTGAIDILVGTHALFSDDIDYKNLGLVIIDEQHRFGVNQRNALLKKGDKADLLLMSATPIPRSLALSIYGDLDVSSLHSFPNERRDVLTKIISSRDKIIIEAINKALKANKNVFIIAPLIEQGSKNKHDAISLFKMYQKLYPEKVSLLHGKMNLDEKLYAFENFKSKNTPILIATSVIEVGIDIKDANTLIVYDADSFGLASLHQLRGRIGRGGEKALCLLIDDNEEEEGKKRLSVLEKSNDGFFIASEDLKMRGPGEIFGIRQSGLPNFRFVNIINDFRIFECARDDADEILKNKDKYAFLLNHVAYLTKNKEDDRD